MQALSPVFSSLIKSLDELIAEVNTAQLTETTALLRIVRIDLVSRAHGITDEELDLLLFAVESERSTHLHINPAELTELRHRMDKTSNC